MKITLIIEHFDPTRGGAERFTVWLAGELAKRGHDVHVVCHDVAPIPSRIDRYRQATQRASHDARRSTTAHFSEDEAVMQGVCIHKLKGLRPTTGIGFRLFARRVAKFLEQHSSDISHSMTVACAGGDIYQPHAGVYAEIQRQAIASRRSVAASHFKRLVLRFSAKQRTLLAMERKAVRSRPNGGGPYRILSLCSMITEHFRKHYRFGAGSPEFFELAGPLTRPLHGDPIKEQEDRGWFRSHYGLTDTDRVAVFVGHDFRRKGLRYAIEAVARAKGWKLLIVGLGKAREYVELANRLGIGDSDAATRRILFVGPTREMDKVYAASDALILPTFYDPFALVVLEALSHGLPVISTEFLGTAYLVKDHGVGTIVATPREVDSMARALESLPIDRETLAPKARAAAASVLPEQYIDKLLGLYEQVRQEKNRAKKT